MCLDPEAYPYGCIEDNIAKFPRPQALPNGCVEDNLSYVFLTPSVAKWLC